MKVAHMAWISSKQMDTHWRSKKEGRREYQGGGYVFSPGRRGCGAAFFVVFFFGSEQYIFFNVGEERGKKLSVHPG